MADCSDTASVSSRGFDYTMLFDDVVGEILVKLDSQKRGEVVDELVDALDMSMLMDVRLKVFKYAKAKLLKTVSQPGNMDLEPNFEGSLPESSLRDMERMVNEWGLIARKGKPRVALDAVDLMSYVSGNDTYFPHRLLKKRPKKKNSGAGKNGSKLVTQPTIPFRPVHDEDMHSETGSSDVDTSSGEDDGLCADGDSDMAANEAMESENDQETGRDGNDQSTLNAKAELESGMDDDLVSADLLGVSTQAAVQFESGHSEVSNAQRLETVATSVDNPEPPPEGQPVVSERESGRRVYANLGITRNESIDIPPIAPQATREKVVIGEVSSNLGIRASNADVTSSTSTPISYLENAIIQNDTPNMTTQTEWDLWGEPLTSPGSTFLMASSCRCEENLRKFKDWKADMERELKRCKDGKAEMEKEVRSRDDQYRSKLNYLREQKLKADDDRDKLRSLIASLSKKVAENTSQMTEMVTRSQRGGIPTRPSANGSVSYHGHNEIEIQQTADDVPVYRGNPSRPSTRQDYGSKALQSQKASSEFVHIFGGDEPVQSMYPDRPYKLTEPVGKQPSVSGSTVVEVSCEARRDSACINEGAGQKQPSDTIPDRPTSNLIYDTTHAAPMPQRPMTQKVRNAIRSEVASSSTDMSQGQSVSVTSLGMRRHRVATPIDIVNESYASTNAGVPLQAPPYSSWADEPVSDAEMQMMINAPTPTTRPMRPPPNTAMKSGEPSRSEILREALMEAQLKDVRTSQQQQANSTGSMNKGKGEKRAYEKNEKEGVNEVKGTYAEVAGDDEHSWNDVVSKNSKKKKAKADESMELLGAGDSHSKDIFVIGLDYSRCRKPQQLENMVKSHCRRRGIEVLYAKAFILKSDPTRANCKIAVNNDDAKKVLGDGFWPKKSYARY